MDILSFYRKFGNEIVEFADVFCWEFTSEEDAAGLQEEF